MLQNNMDELDQVQVNIWVCGKEVLRCVSESVHTRSYSVSMYSRMKSTHTKFGVLV